MKRLFFTLITCLIFATGYGSHLNSAIDIRSWNNSSFVLVLNHQTYGQNNFHTLKNVAPGRHRVKLMKREGHSSRGPMRVVYNGFIDVPASSQVSAVFRPNSGLNIVNVSPLFVAGQCGQGCGNGACANGGGVDYYDNRPQGNGNAGNGGNNWNGNGQGHGHSQGQGNGRGRGNGGNHMNNTGNFGNVSYGLNQQQFNNLSYQLRNTPFDNDKLNIAMQAIQANGVTSQQVRQMMQELSFEANRLKLAKRAYQHTIDKQQYFIVNDAFAFSSSVQQLNDHIYGRGR